MTSDQSDARMTSDHLEVILAELEMPILPQSFARSVAERIALSAQMATLGNAHPPPDFANLLAKKIALDAAKNPLLSLEPVEVPFDFAQRLSVQISTDANPLQFLTPVVAPANFAFLMAGRISSQVNPLAALSPVQAPVHFAARVATQIAKEAAVNAEHDRTPLYFLGTLLAGVALAFGALTWRDAQAAGVALFEVLRSLPESLVLPVALVALFAVMATLAQRVVRFPAAVAAFGVAAAFVVPQLSGWFGNARIDGAVQLASVVRFAGDITVASEVRGDVIAIGGSVRLERGARVSGRILTFLGDVNLPEGTSVQAASAVLGNLSSGTKDANQKSFALPGLSAASAFRPIRNLIVAETWQWWYFGLLSVLAAALVLLPRVQESLQPAFNKDAGRSLGLGLLLLFLTVPVVALGGLSVLGTPFALVLGIFTVIAFSSGAAIAVVMLGKRVLPNSGLLFLPGLLIFAVSMLIPALAMTLWLLAGAWGAGALLIALRQGAFMRAVAAE
jgi:hypothetical protein